MNPTVRLQSALSDIIEGKNVKRSKHELIFEGKNVTELFVESLRKQHFIPITVGAITIEPSERVPAFIIEENTAYFGWVFWEKFSQLRLRKLFGTVIRNTKGDWLIQLPSNSTKLIYADTSQIFEMDIDRPFEL
ncbi:MAG: hypothetical protein Q8L88_01070 [Bacteroidota bacterium]|nr:hypothetical protein [Bacteroidota bacterium]